MENEKDFKENVIRIVKDFKENVIKIVKSIKRTESSYYFNICFVIIGIITIIICIVAIYK